jgi:tetratricopeptide (TPR) repeat protein
MMRANYGAASKAAAESARLAEQANLLDVVATARLTELWISTWTTMADNEAHERLAALAIDACQRAGDVPGEIEARHLGSQVLYARGLLNDYAQINQALLERARAISDGAHAALILERLAHVELLTGDPQNADAYLAEADVLARKLGLRNVALRLMAANALRLMQAAQFEASIRAYQEVVAIAEEAGVVQSQLTGLRFMSYSFQLKHRYDEMARVLDQAVELSESSGELWNRAELLALRSRAALELGDTDAAEQFIQRALEIVRPEDITGTAEVYDHLGVLRAAQGRDEQAESAFRHSSDAVRNTRYHWVQETTAMDLARYLAQRNRLAEASAELNRMARAWPMWEEAIAETRATIEKASQTQH